MLSDAIGDLLPSAIAVALSPIPIVAVVLVLGTPSARTAGPMFALGWVCGLAAVSAFVVLALGNSVGSDTETGIEWFKVAIGILFLIMAAEHPGAFWHDRRPRPKHRVPWTRESAAERAALFDRCAELCGLDPASLGS